MIYPKGIVDFVLNDCTLKERFSKDVEGHSLNVSGRTRVTSYDFERWMVKEGQFQSHEIKRYIYFLAIMGEIFNNIARFFNKVNEGRENEKDRFTMGTSSQEMLYIARYL